MCKKSYFSNYCALHFDISCYQKVLRKMEAVLSSSLPLAIQSNFKKLFNFNRFPGYSILTGFRWNDLFFLSCMNSCTPCQTTTPTRAPHGTCSSRSFIELRNPAGRILCTDDERNLWMRCEELLNKHFFLFSAQGRQPVAETNLWCYFVAREIDFSSFTYIWLNKRNQNKIQKHSKNLWFDGELEPFWSQTNAKL